MSHAASYKDPNFQLDRTLLNINKIDELGLSWVHKSGIY